MTPFVIVLTYFCTVAHAPQIVVHGVVPPEVLSVGVFWSPLPGTPVLLCCSYSMYSTGRTQYLSEPCSHYHPHPQVAKAGYQVRVKRGQEIRKFNIG